MRKNRLAVLRTLREDALKAIHGQDRAVDSFVRAVCRAEAASVDALRRRPKANVLAYGPTGVGKTELTAVISDLLYGPGALVVFDMAEFAGEEGLESFLGSGGKPGRFSHKVRGREEGVLLLDEIEKAHEKVFLQLLQLLEGGRLTSADGTVHDLRHWYVVCTSNVAGREISELDGIPYSSLEEIGKSVLLGTWRPEIVNRFDLTLLFLPLAYSHQRSIAQQMLERKCKEVEGICGGKVTVSREAVEAVIRRGMDRRLGARPLRRYVEQAVGDAVARRRLDGESGDGVLCVDGKRIVIRPTAPNRTTEELLALAREENAELTLRLRDLEAELRDARRKILESESVL